MKNTLEQIYKSSLKFLLPLSLEETFATIVREAEDLVHAEYGSLLLEDSGELKRVFSTLPVSALVDIRKEGFSYQSFTKQQAFVRNAEAFGKYHPEIKDLGVKSNIFIPLSHAGQSIGVLIVNSMESKTFTKRDLDVLKIFGTYASLAIKKAQHAHDLNKALEIRDVFLSMASHELRTPLTSINGYIQLLHSKLANQNSSESRWVGELVRESDRLTRLVKELLEINRIKAGQFQYSWQECQMRDIIKQSLKAFAFSFPDREVIYEDKTDGARAIMVGDSAKLVQALDNILENAAKYSEADTLIKVLFDVRDNNLVIKIKDQGRGIAKEDLPKIFDSFYQGNNHKKEGIGIGLFLVKDIIEHHRGHIKVLSKINRGTTFELVLPKAKV